MPGGSKKTADFALITHLAAGVSPAGTAKLAGVSEATAYRRLADPAFRQRVEKARSDFWERALGVMARGVVEAGMVLRRLLRSSDARTQLQAAKTMLEHAINVRGIVELQKQLDELEEKIGGDRRKSDASE